MRILKTRFLVLFIILLAGLSFSSPVFAGQKALNVNNSAYPDLTNPNCVKSILYPNGSPENPECVWLYPLTAPRVIPGSIDLDWEIEGIQNPFCAVTCTREDGGSCAGAFGKKDGLFNPTPVFPDGWNFTASDKVGTLASKIGDIYQVYCCEKQDKPTILNMCKTAGVNGGVYKFSNKVKVANSQSCEVPFSQIKEAFNTGRPVHITELPKLDKWVATTQDQDYTVKNPTGSGDTRNIQELLISNQCDYIAKCLPTNSCPVKPVYFNAHISYLEESLAWKTKVEELEFQVGSGWPAQLTFRALDWPVKISGQDVNKIAHSVIAVGVSGSSDMGYDFDIIDPNYPNEITKLSNCRYALMEITYDGNLYSYTGLGCDSSKYSKDGQILIGNWDLLTQKKEDYKKFCGNTQNFTSFSNLCVSRNINRWLRENLTNLVNPTPNGGNCFAWTTFYLNMAYLGDFVGTDYHPDDGKIVGRDCDANHYPISKVAQNSTSGTLLHQGFAGAGIRGLAGEWGLANIFQLKRFINWLGLVI